MTENLSVAELVEVKACSISPSDRLVTLSHFVTAPSREHIYILFDGFSMPGNLSTGSR
jgi:hypothetical protein